ncbi:uncharacterized protein LOC132788222 [Drosophila nasuta]|uniref:uncharacterized protein LOC132788222 n=1 Tax=Drosophila nasuta TaxID=42062 RepID=UPI00295ED27D|nr:uncharacterized protein LOC132788222 [Drosophila nasuta]
MEQRRNAKSVRNFVILFLLILQNCGEARSVPNIERRDGLAKLEFSAKQRDAEAEVEAEAGKQEEHNVFNFAKIYETFYAQLMHNTTAGQKQGRGIRSPQAQLMWETPAEEVVVVTSPKPYHLVDPLHPDLVAARKHTTTTMKPFSILEHLSQEQAELLRQHRRNVSLNLLQALHMEEQLLDQHTTTVKPVNVFEQLNEELTEQEKHTTTSKPFSILEQLSLQQAEQLRLKLPNSSFSLLEALHMEQQQLDNHTTTVKPFHLAAQLNQELDKHEGVEEQAAQSAQEELFEVEQTVTAPLEQHKEAEQQKAVEPEESTRAKDSQKRRRKRIRRRRKRIRRRRKRTRRRRRKKRKKRRKKRKKKKHKGDKDKKKRKKRRKKPYDTHSPVIGQQAQLIYANPTKQPYHSHGDYYPHGHPYPHAQQPQLVQLVTTKRPATTPAPFSKIKYLLRHNSLFKKKKKEWFNHVGHVLYPFIKFVAFFTVLNPFTLGVFLFTLISPVVFGFLGFIALSVLVKPFLHLVFGVKDSVDAIDRQRYLANKRAQQLKLNLRPVTIHKHYYQQKQLHSTPPQRYRPLADWRRQSPPHPLDRRQLAPHPPERQQTASLHPPERRPTRPSRPPERRHNPLLPADREVFGFL